MSYETVLGLVSWKGNRNRRDPKRYGRRLNLRGDVARGPGHGILRERLATAELKKWSTGSAKMKPLTLLYPERRGQFRWFHSHTKLFILHHGVY